jgi:class 3 adenylate cyclase
MSIAQTPDSEATATSSLPLDAVDEFRKQHKTAVLTVMFTDLKGSTSLAEARGEIVAQTCE